MISFLNWGQNLRTCMRLKLSIHVRLALISRPVNIVREMNIDKHDL